MSLSLTSSVCIWRGPQIRRPTREATREWSLIYDSPSVHHRYSIFSEGELMVTHLTRRARGRALSLLTVLTIIATFVSACGTSGGGGIKAGPGVDTAKKVINLGILTPLSGPVAAPIGIPLTKGIEVFFQYVNKELGGIDGYQVVLNEQDSKYNPQTQATEYNQIHNDIAMVA